MYETVRLRITSKVIDTLRPYIKKFFSKYELTQTNCTKCKAENVEGVSEVQDGLPHKHICKNCDPALFKAVTKIYAF
jgi:hypothetical protein